MDVPPEVITGYADVNHWNVWQVDADTFKHHQEPITIAGVEALTLGYLRHRLIVAARWTPDLIDRLVIWYDPASLVAQPDMRDAANDAFDRQTISAKAHRRYLGMDEGDAPEPTAAETGEPVGTTELTVDRLTAIANAANVLLRAGYVPDAVNTALGLAMITHSGVVPGATPPEAAPLPAAPGTPALPAGTDTPAPADSAAQPITAAAARPPARRGHPTAQQRRLSRRLMEIDRRLRERIAAAADAALARALERAGNRIRSAANRMPEARTAAAGLPAERVPAALGRTLVAALGAEEQQLLTEAFDKLHAQWTEWTQAAAAEAIDTAARITGLQPGSPEVMRAVGALRDSYAALAETAWPALHGGLNDLAVDLLYHPDPAVPDVGELPDGLVPPGLVRDALATAGGLAADATGQPPLSGLTSGQLLTSFLRDNGAVPVEYEWTYGISSRPFKPHQRLDGLVFHSFADPGLDTSGSGGEWVGGTFAPGDHKGCHCDYAVIYADGNTRDEREALGRRAYEEQKPGEVVPGPTATLHGILDEPGRVRPDTWRTAEAEAAALLRAAPAPAPLPAGIPPTPPAAPSGRRVKRPANDDAGVPWTLNHDYLSHLDDDELDDLLDHVAGTLGDLDPRAEQRWNDLDHYLSFTEGRAAQQEALLSGEEVLDWGEVQRRLRAWEEINGRAGLTHPRVGGTARAPAGSVPSRAEVQADYALHVELAYAEAEAATNGFMLNAAGRARGIDPRSLMTGDVRQVYRYASDELLEHFEGTRRVTWSEFYYARTGNPNYASTAARHAQANARINRDRTER
jgi:hypothetical protein